MLAFGSDTLVEPINPVRGIAAATGNGWRMQEASPVGMALAGFAVWAARSGLREDKAGTLEPSAWKIFSKWTAIPSLFPSQTSPASKQTKRRSLAPASSGGRSPIAPDRDQAPPASRRRP
ncbi:hypothetical protein [Thermaurantiacus sp.]